MPPEAASSKWAEEAGFNKTLLGSLRLVRQNDA